MPPYDLSIHVCVVKKSSHIDDIEICDVAQILIAAYITYCACGNIVIVMIYYTEVTIEWFDPFLVFY